MPEIFVVLFIILAIPLLNWIFHNYPMALLLCCNVGYLVLLAMHIRQDLRVRHVVRERHGPP